MAAKEETMRRFFLAVIPSRRGIIWTAVVLFILPVAGGLFYLANGEQLYDSSFDTRVVEPAYRTPGPCVLFDEAHLNHHTANGRYKPFADLITNDGYDVQRNRDAFSVERLARVSVLVVVCAKGKNDAHDAPAFEDGETAAVEQWVRSGGSLLLVTDHFPFSSAAASLGGRFGVDMRNGMVEDPKHHEPTLGDSHLVFSRANGLLLDHCITQGRNPTERIERVLTFTGQSLKAPADGSAFLRLSDSAVDRPASAPTIEKVGRDVRVTVTYGDPVSAKGRAQGLALQRGKGRVVVLGEAGMLSAQRDRRGSPVGMNFPGYDNRQLALNIMHWLSRLL
jgi:hypothetical protein